VRSTLSKSVQPSATWLYLGILATLHTTQKCFTHKTPPTVDQQRVTRPDAKKAATMYGFCMTCDCRDESLLLSILSYPTSGRNSVNRKLSYRWQTARRICAKAMAMAIPIKHAPPHVLPAEYSRSVWTHVGATPKLGNRTLEMGRGWETRFSPRVTLLNLFILTQTVWM